MNTPGIRYAFTKGRRPIIRSIIPSHPTHTNSDRLLTLFQLKTLGHSKSQHSGPTTMASASTRGDNKRKIDALETEVAQLKSQVEHQGHVQEQLRRRVDSLDKSSLLVVENNSESED